MDLGIKKRTALVTAASKGIGRAIAEELISEGVKVAICSSNQENLISTAGEIKANYGEEPLWVKCDLSKEENIKKTFEIVQEEFGSVDILVNNCGGPPTGKIESIDEAVWNESYKQMFMSIVRFVNLVLPGMKQKHWGRIINITSFTVKQPAKHFAISNSMRAAVRGFTKTLSNEAGEFNITANCVAPGYTLTHRLYELAVEIAKETGDSHEHVLGELACKVPLKRLARPDEIASTVTFLASEKAGYITGNIIPVDGGIVKSAF